MKIQLTYAIDGHKAVRITGIWPSTWAAVEWAQEHGALVAMAKRVA